MSETIAFFENFSLASMLHWYAGGVVKRNPKKAEKVGQNTTANAIRAIFLIFVSFL